MRIDHLSRLPVMPPSTFNVNVDAMVVTDVMKKMVLVALAVLIMLMKFVVYCLFVLI